MVLSALKYCYLIVKYNFQINKNNMCKILQKGYVINHYSSPKPRKFGTQKWLNRSGIGS